MTTPVQLSLFIAAPASSPKLRRFAGYAAIPGTGPPWETCATCRHLVLDQGQQHRAKCRLRIDDWRDRPGALITSISRTSPACSKWDMTHDLDRLVRLDIHRPQSDPPPRLPRRRGDAPSSLLSS